MLERLEGSREALDESVRAQRQLVADASHELRTPVTSLRTNIEVLLAGGELDPEDRRRLLGDVVEQSEELTALVGDLIELARGDQPGSRPRTSGWTGWSRSPGPRAAQLARDRVRADARAGDARRRPRAPRPRDQQPARQRRPPLAAGRRGRGDASTSDGVRVRDHGSGIAEADLPYVFDRFFRGANSRGRQGSGLGLAIVRQVTEQHGGTVAGGQRARRRRGVHAAAAGGRRPAARRPPGEPRGRPDAEPARGARRSPRAAAESGGSRRRLRPRDAARRPRHPGLARGRNAAQQPEQDGEHRDHDEQQQRPLAGSPNTATSSGLERDRGDRRQQ